MFKLDAIKVSLPLKQKFVVSKGEAKVKTNVLTILNNRYIGEASGSVHYGPTIEEIERDLRTGMKYIGKCSKINMDTVQDVGKLPLHAIARSALVAMLLNYISGETRRYPWEILNLGTPVGVKSSFTISISSPAEMIDAIKNCEYPIIKIKMGNEEDIMILEILDQIKGKEFRVDANGGWSCAKAEEMIFFLSQKGVRIIEQPTDIAYVEEWQHLKKKLPDIELIMDEGLNNVEDYGKYSPLIDGVNIKMEKCGGVIEGVKIAEAAKAENKKVMLGCMVGSSISIAQSLYMSSRADYYDLDGPLLLKDDIAQGIKYDRESIEVDREIIGGPKLIRDVIEKYIAD